MQNQNEVSLLFFILIFDFKQELSKLNMRNNAIFVRVFLSNLNKVVPKLLMTSASNQVPPVRHCTNTMQMRTSVLLCRQSRHTAATHENEI